MKLLLLPVVVLVAVLLSPAGCELYYVQGSSPDATPCPPEASPCLTLQEYVDNSSEFLPENMSDVEFRFLSGEHLLSKPFKVDGGRNVSLRSAIFTSVWDGLDVTVSCRNDSNFEFYRTSQLSIHGILFHKCGSSNIYSALMLDTVVDFEMQDVEFFGSFYSDVVVLDSYGIYNISDCQTVGVSGRKARAHVIVYPGDGTFDVYFNNMFISANADFGIWFANVACGSQYAYHNDSSLTLRNVTVNHGIQIAVWVCASAKVVVEKCTFSAESSIPFYASASGPTTIVDSTFSNFFIFGLIYQALPMGSGEQKQAITENLELAHSDSEHYILVSNCSFTEGRQRLEGDIEGGIIAITATGSSAAVVLRNVLFEDNNDLPTANPLVFLQDVHNVTIEGVRFINNSGTPFLLRNTVIHVFGENFFIGNHAFDGGGMTFIYNSSLVLHNNSLMVFRDNYADRAGGAWYVASEDFLSIPFLFNSVLIDKPRDPCFITIQPPPSSLDELSALNISVLFVNNFARNGGNVLYGGNIDLCAVDDTSKDLFADGSDLFHEKSIFSYEPENDHSRLASPPTRVCLCEHGVPNCLMINSTMQGIYPGQTFNISVVTVGQQFGVVNGTVYGQLQPLANHSNSHLEGLLSSQRVGQPECTSLNYSIRSNGSAEILVLTARELIATRIADEKDISKYRTDGRITKRLLSTPVHVTVSLLDCPPGFILSEESLQCVCDPTITANGLTCDIDIGNGTVQRSGEVWVTYWTSNQSTGQDGVVVSLHCPNGYCSEKTQHINLDNPDEQCNLNRTGVLCAACPPGLSLALGSNRCLKCSNSFYTLLIPFAVSGVLLVLFIQLLDLTVAVGTINGLLFYANILKTCETLFFVPGQTNILTVFISWLNLDLGIETCFFDGLDGYGKTWLQFAYPFYLWILAGLIVLLSRYTDWVSAGNSVPVLATIVLLSYNKLIRTIITILFLTPLKLPDRFTLYSWTFDGNVPYFGPEYTVLFLIGLLVFALAWLPYTLALLFYQCLLRVNHKRGCRWVFKLKPFFDANFGPLKDKHLYWVGILLLARAVLLVTFVASVDSTDGTLIAVTVVSSFLTLWDSYLGHAYKNWLLSLLESSFFVNLTILCASTYYAKLIKNGQAAVIYTSISIAFVEFIAIVCYHSYKRVMSLLQRIKERRLRRQDYAELRSKGDGQPPNKAVLPTVVTHSEVDVYDPAARFALREALLED